MQIDLTDIIKAIIGIVAAIVFLKLVPWIQSKTTAQQQANLRAIYRVFVCAAEQIFGAGNGPQKLEYVLDGLEKLGLKVDLAEIEAAVYQEFNSYTPMLKPCGHGEDEGDEGPEEACGECGAAGEDGEDEADEADEEAGEVSDEEPCGAAGVTVVSSEEAEVPGVSGAACEEEAEAVTGTQNNDPPGDAAEGREE